MIRAALSGALVLAAMSATPARSATLLYPNLKTLPPRDLRFDRADVDAEGGGMMHNVLRFSNTVWNSGPGPLEMHGLFDPETNTRPAVQRVYDDAGGFADFPAGFFYYHPAHDHYHYDNWGRYELWTKAGYEAWLASGRTEGTPMLGSKTTSCMIDEEFIRNLPNQPYPPVYGTDGCFPNSQGQMLQGISPGWGDTYDYFRFEQWIDLGASGSLPDGEYVLRSVADPLNKIYESSEKADPSRESQEDNEAITPFAVAEGKLVDSNPPSGSVRIDDIDVATSSPSVIVKVLGRDDVSGVTEVRLSNDGSQWSAPQPYTGLESTAQAIGWNLIDPAYGGTDSDGTKTVFAEFRDATGKWSAAETDTIVLDRSGNSSPYSNAVLADGPSGYWRLGETGGVTASDAAGANTGLYRNGPLLDQPSLLPADPANGAVSFDGTNDYVEIPSSGPLSPSARISVEAWVEPVALPQAGSFASIASKPGSYSLQFDGPSLEFAIIQSGTSRRLQAPAGTIQPGQAYYVVGTYDGTTQRLYVDGVEVANAPLTGQISVGSVELSIASWNEGSEPFDGTIDEVAVYPSALSAARVDAHYQAGIGGTPPDMTVNAPSGLTATAASQTSVDLQWSDNSDNEGEFRIERATDPAFGSPVVQGVWADSTTFTDSGLSPGTTYYYRVRAMNATDSSAYSNVASVTTPAPPLPEVPAPAVTTPSPDLALSPKSPLARYAAAALGDRPIGYWRLDELSGSTAVDAVGSNPGGYRGGPELGQASLVPSDRLGHAVGFSGAGERVEVPRSVSLALARQVSIEAWIKPTALPRRGGFAFIAGEPGSYSLELDGSRLAFRIVDASGVRLLRAPAGLAAGRAHHVVGTYDGKTERLFIDGARVASAPLSGSIAVSAHPFDIGSTGSAHTQFKGAVDEVALYSRALPAARVSAHYRAGTWHRPRT